MSGYNHERERTKAFKNLAGFCHDKALGCMSASETARWAALMDTLMWCASGDGDTGAILIHADRVST